MAGIGSLVFWKAYAITMRPYLLFVSAAAGMAGFAIGPDREGLVIFLTFLVLFLSYGFGQALTDCFQMDTDSLSSPYRPLIQGMIDRSHVLWISSMGLVLGCVMLFVFNPWTLLLGFLAVFGLATYTFFKRKWWGGPFYNAWIVALLPIIGALAASGPGFDPVNIFKHGFLLPITCSVFFSYANFVLMGYFKDISADKQSGYQTFVVVFGWKKAAIGSDILALLSVLASGWGIVFWLLTTEGPLFRWISPALLIAAAAVLASAQIGIHRAGDEKKAFGPIVNVVRGFIFLHTAEVCLLKPSWIPAAAIFYAAFEWVLKKRPAKEQV